jgi:hypothetical protein
MREEKRRSIEAGAKLGIQCELHGIPMTLPSAAKYKKQKYDKRAGPDLEVGRKVVLALNKGMERIGLYLAVLVDWEDEQGWWTSRSRLYFVVLENSNHKIPDRIGRIVSAIWPYEHYCSSHSVISWNSADFKKVE